VEENAEERRRRRSKEKERERGEAEKKQNGSVWKMARQSTSAGKTALEVSNMIAKDTARNCAEQSPMSGSNGEFLLFSISEATAHLEESLGSVLLGTGWEAWVA
jgi:hypothetical protein